MRISNKAHYSPSPATTSAHHASRYAPPPSPSAALTPAHLHAHRPHERTYKANSRPRKHNCKPAATRTTNIANKMPPRAITANWPNLSPHRATTRADSPTARQPIQDQPAQGPIRRGTQSTPRQQADAQGSPTQGGQPATDPTQTPPKRPRRSFPWAPQHTTGSPRRTIS